MSQYRPAFRRPISSVFRTTAHAAVAACLRLGVHPDLVSLSSMVAGGLAGACFWQAGKAPVLLLSGAGLCVVRLWLNMLDGMVALASGKASRRGEIFNELPDRFSDVAIFVGVAHSGLCHEMAGYWAAIMSLATAYVGTLGQAVGSTTRVWRRHVQALADGRRDGRRLWGLVVALARQHPFGMGGTDAA